MSGRTCVILLLIAGIGLQACTLGSAPENTVRTTTAIAPTPVDLPDFGGPEDLEKAMFAFGECVERDFPISMRFTTDPYVGFSTEVGSLREEDGDRVDEVTAICMARTDLDRRLSVFQMTNPVTPEEERGIAADFIACAVEVSPEMADLVADFGFENQDDVGRFIVSLRPQDFAADRSDLIAVSACQEEMTGPEYVFADGYPWFRP